MIELINPMFERVRLIDFFVEMHQKKKKEKVCNNALSALMQFSFHFWLILRYDSMIIFMQKKKKKKKKEKLTL